MQPMHRFSTTFLALCLLSVALVLPARAQSTDSITTAQLTRDKAQQLATESKNWLSLNGVTALTDAQIATTLCSHQGGGLVLDGVTNLSTAAATALANYPGWLSLGGLSSLSTAQAQELAKHTGKGIYLNGVRAIDQTVAAKFSTHTGWLSLSGLKKTGPKNDGGLTKKIATELAKHPGPLCLNGINDIDPAVLGELANGCRGGLDLSGLTSLTPAQFKSLRNHSGWLALDGLTSIPDNVVSHLVAHDGSVGLLGITTISGNQNTARQTLRAAGDVRLPAAMR